LHSTHLTSTRLPQSAHGLLSPHAGQVTVHFTTSAVG
jgi:hypothetical protein